MRSVAGCEPAAHSFIPTEYWKANQALVRELLPQAEVYVYEKNGEILGFAGLDGEYIERPRRRTNRHMRPRTPVLLTKLFAGPVYDRRARRTANLHVEESCIGCGLCARNCPVQAIAMQEKRPVWVREKCVMCLGCLHRCPKFAIQYGSRTKKHGQYINPNGKVQGRKVKQMEETNEHHDPPHAA